MLILFEYLFDISYQNVSCATTHFHSKIRIPIMRLQACIIAREQKYSDEPIFGFEICNNISKIKVYLCCND